MSLLSDRLLLPDSSILLDDVISCRLEDANGDENQNASTSSLTIESYPLRESRRKRETQTVSLSSLEDCQKLRSAVAMATRKPVAPHLLRDSPTNRVLVLINPFSGQKRAVQLWKDYGSPVLETAGIQTDIVMTEYPRHATKIVQSMEIDLYDAILVNSGDGLVSEVLSGLLFRRDRARALLIPICHIPGGTSNALAAAILFTCNEPFSPRDVFVTECAVMAARPRYLPLRLFRVETEHDGIKPMFMSACWGLVADIDIGSERFRWAGMARLHIEAILRILQLPRVARYHGRVSYIPLNDKRVSRNTVLPHHSKRELFGEEHFKYQEVEKATGQERSLPQDFESVSEAVGAPFIKVPSLNEPLDDRWVTVEGEWVMVNVTAISHLGSDLPCLPSARLGEPILYLALLDWAVIKSRLDVADLFVRMNNSIHLSYPCFQIIPVHAVRVEPLTRHGYFAIDGEPCVNGSKFQVVASDLSATVIGRNEVVRR